MGDSGATELMFPNALYMGNVNENSFGILRESSTEDVGTNLFSDSATRSVVWQPVNLKLNMQSAADERWRALISCGQG